MPSQIHRLSDSPIDKGSCSDAHPDPLLFVHGAWHAAWCWDEHFLDFFADKGYRALAVSLRGHGGSPTTKALRNCSVTDYVDDVASVADSLPTRPVVIGHSMGGYVVQKYLESHEAPAGVLVASVPPRGIAGFLLRFTMQHPWRLTKALITGKSSAMFNTPDTVREKFFSARTPESTVAHCAGQIQDESRRITLDAMVLNLPRPERVTTPLLVLGAESDDCFTTEEVRSTARAYRTEAQIFPEIGHDVMLEPGWVAVAEHIHTWLETHDPARKRLQSG
ncbi:alpha/beta hydrolase [Mycolicibacterium novocastrense]|uniref:Alpha/beta hydrolase n=1 Tax=Mycolicibacterium novocastrense TaxID=59813 RepID=A0AAW5SSL3_MYCNV|nr:alpha/beta hydrolase [Mycolicibacterium novocastrense]MCV7026582.1 alpha/beta hydrolase [Mycolicibacterium novocastrense]GAT13024.1 alpha/beta hydrolase fold protein [Mycolicibacterium novocastrense]